VYLLFLFFILYHLFVLKKMIITQSKPTLIFRCLVTIAITIAITIGLGTKSPMHPVHQNCTQIFHFTTHAYFLCMKV
jgi:hypothetical protein